MDPQRWEEVQAAFEELAGLSEAERRSRLAAIGTKDPALRAAIESLLVADADADERLAPIDAALPSRGGAKPVQSLKDALAHRYTIERELGRGGTALVYLARDRKLDRQVAIKVLKPELAAAIGRERFLREIKLTARLEHPNILTLYDAAEVDGFVYYAMPYVDGESLRDRLKRGGQLGLEDAVRISRAVADALGHAHARHVIHRDITPGNIMIGKGGQVVVTDFGIAKELRAGSLTVSGAVLGTPHYMSPEQYLGTEVTGAADQYSLAVVTYQMLAGRVPFEATSAYELLNRHVSTPPPSLRELRPGLPSHVYWAVDRALAKTPGKRFTSVGDFVAALENPSPDTPRVLPEQPNRRRVAVAGTIAVIAVAGIVGVIAVSGNGQERTETVAGAPDTADGALTDVVAEAAASRARVPDTAAAETPRPPADAPTPSSVATRPVEAANPSTGAPEPEFGVLILRLSSWANIYVDQSFVRPGRVHRDTLSPGTHVVRLERDGYATVDTSVVVVAGETITLSLSMRERD
jgi:tRNA A-37 threonylcarbamoyl transferase component Bud32